MIAFIKDNKILVGVCVFLLIASVEHEKENRAEALAAIKDSGCNTHIDIPAPKNATNAANYNMKGFE